MNRADRRRQQYLSRKLPAGIKPDSINRLRAKAAEHLQAGDSSQAQRALVNLLQAKPDDAEALNLLGILAGQHGDYMAACELLGKAVRINPEQPSFHNNLALALRGAGRLEGAVEEFRKTITLDPDLIQAHNNLGSTLKRLGDTDGAIAAYRQAMQLNQNYSDACFNLGKLLRRSGKPDEAAEVLATALERNEADFELRRQLGLALMDQGKFDEAAGELATSLRNRLSSDNPTPEKTEATRLDRTLARKALADLKQILDESDVEFFLRSGTLLGYVREGNLLKHDKDIDIGVFENPSLNIVSDVLQKTGKFTQKPDNYSRQNRVSLTVVHNNGTPFDIYQHQDSGKYYRVENFNPGCSFVRRFTRFGLKPVSFLGTTFNIPNNPELYLTELYGNDWHIPNPFFDSRVSSMNMEPGMEIISKCYAYCRIGGALERSDTERALAYCDQVLDRFPDDEIALEVQNSQKCLN